VSFCTQAVRRMTLDPSASPCSVNQNIGLPINRWGLPALSRPFLSLRNRNKRGTSHGAQDRSTVHFVSFPIGS
jgi:hypothetical protein